MVVLLVVVAPGPKRATQVVLEAGGCLRVQPRSWTAASATAIATNRRISGKGGGRASSSGPRVKIFGVSKSIRRRLCRQRRSCTLGLEGKSAVGYAARGLTARRELGAGGRELECWEFEGKSAVGYAARGLTASRGLEVGTGREGVGLLGV